MRTTVAGAAIYEEVASTRKNPYKTGIIFVVVGILIFVIGAVTSIFMVGIIKVPDWAFAAGVSIFSGLLTMAIVLCFTIPAIKQAMGSEKIEAKVIGYTEQTVSGRNGNMRMYAPVVEYTYEGKTYSDVELSSLSSFKPKEGSTRRILVSTKDPTQVMLPRRVWFMVFASIMFTGAATIFAIPGIKMIQARDVQFSDNVVVEVKETGTEDAKKFATLWFWGLTGFALVFGGIGAGVCIHTKKKEEHKKFLESCIKKTVKVTNIEINEKVEINGLNPTKITCSDEYGKTYLYKTTSFRGTYQIGEELEVYVDPEDSEKYYFD